MTQACMRSSYADTVGAGKPGSANAPTGMATQSGRPSGSKYTVAPQRGQQWKRAPGAVVAGQHVIGRHARSDHAVAPEARLLAEQAFGWGFEDC